jgi:hypothetical protein
MLVLLLSVGATRAAQAAPCYAGPADDPFPICFDPGRRLVLELGYGDDGAGIGAGLALRHVAATDDNDITWRLEHDIGTVRHAGDTWRGALYEGRYSRHSRDGHIVLPTSPPKKLFLPFDIGGEADVGAFVTTPGSSEVRLGLVRAALFFDLARSESPFLERLAFGIATRWDVIAPDLRRPFSVAEHFAAPFSLGVAELHLESRDGLSILDVSVEAGERWSSQKGWGATLDATAGVERVLIAFDDRPVSVYCQAGWEAPGRGPWVTAGLRIGLVASTPTRPGR